MSHLPKFEIVRADGSVLGYTNTFRQAVRYLMGFTKPYDIYEITWEKKSYWDSGPRKVKSKELVCSYSLAP